jgi:tetratricopeptide (TPR) repeat protein
MELKEKTLFEANKFFIAGEYKKGIKTLKEFLKIHINDYDASLALSIFYEITKEKSKSFKLLKKLINDYPNEAPSYNNLGNLLYKDGSIDEAIKNLRIALSLDSSLENVHNNLADYLYIKGEYKEAISFYIESPKANTAEILRCLLAQKNYNKFWELLEENINEKNSYLINSDYENIKVAAISAYASEKLGVSDIYPFCPNPLEFIYKNKINFLDSNITDLFKDLKLLSNTLDTESRSQDLLKNGIQTSGNFFSNDLLGEKLAKYVGSLLVGYKNHFSNKDCYLINHWPKNIRLNGWTIHMNNSGSISSHNHEKGWVSGSLYLQIPSDIAHDEGAIKFSLEGPRYPKINKNIVQSKTMKIETGDIIMFPSSLFHNTIPFKSSKKRITFAFDLAPPEKDEYSR